MKKELAENLFSYICLISGIILGIIGTPGWGFLIFLAILMYY